LPVSQARMLLALTINVIGSESFPVQKIVGKRLHLLGGNGTNESHNERNNPRRQWASAKRSNSILRRY
jgi:hypothetical protein